MPLYEYECQQCQHRLEKIQKFSDPELTVCPHCGGKLERTVTAPSFQFAGGGWYKDGYGNTKPAASGSSENTSPASNSKESSSTPASSEAKPAAAPSAPAAAPAPAASSTKP